MKALDFLFEADLSQVAKTPVKGGKTLGQAVQAVAAEQTKNPEISELEALELLAQADPTPQNKLVKWIARVYLDPNQSLILPEDASKVAEALATYLKAVRAKAIPEEQRDINKIKTLRDLYAITDELGDEDIKSQREIKRDTKTEGAEKVIDTPGFVVYKLKNQEAACLLGKGTKWCTAGDNNNQFDNYNEQGDLYVLVAGEGDKQRKFQFHFESDQFMDEQDQEVDQKDIDLLSQYPGYKDFLNSQIEKHYAKYIENNEEE